MSCPEVAYTTVFFCSKATSQLIAGGSGFGIFDV